MVFRQHHVVIKGKFPVYQSHRNHSIQSDATRRSVLPSTQRNDQVCWWSRVNSLYETGEYCWRLNGGQHSKAYLGSVVTGLN
ncbi:hypothetical protein ES702_03031 [subsurface metagenome]